MDQVLSSGSNFVVTVVAANSLSADGFGRFALALTIAAVGIFLVRGFASDPLATAHAGDVELRGPIRSGASAAWASSLVVAVPTAVVAGIAGGQTGLALLVLAVTMPGMALQDYIRFALIVQRRARDTFVNDLLWTVIQVPLLVLAIVAGAGSPGLLGAWAGAANIAAVVGLWQLRMLPGGPGSVRSWLGRHRALWPYYVLDNMIRQASILILVLVLSVTTSVAQVGAFRGAMLFYSPLTILSVGIVSVAVPELARRRTDPAAVKRASLILGLGLAPLALVVAAILAVLPDAAGERMLGDTWKLASPLVVLAAGPTFASLFIIGVGIGIRALGAGREGVSARVLAAVVAAGFAGVGAVLDGAHGAMLALVFSAPLQMAAWWVLLRRAKVPDEIAGGEEPAGSTSERRD